MRSNAEWLTDVDLREAQVSVPKLALWLGLAVLLNARVRK